MKLGIVMEGGASRTIFSCGVTDVFLDEKLMPDYLIGVSAGIAYGVSYISGQRGRNAQFTKEYMHDKRYMGIRHWLNPKTRCYYNIDFAFDQMANQIIPFDYDALAHYPGKVVAVVTNVRTGQAEYKELPPYERKWETTVASCSLPVLFPPVRLGGEFYMDGGISDSIPYKKALDEGCDKVIVILTREREYQLQEEKAARLIYLACRKYPEIVKQLKSRSERYNRCCEEMFELERQGKLLVIAPEDTYGVTRTERKWSHLEPLYQEGIRIARKEMPRIREYLKS